MLREFLSYFYSRAGDTYNYLTDGEIAYGKHYSVLRHPRPFVVYQGTKTQIAVTVFGDAPLPKERRVFLQRRGYRTGLLGWTLGGLLGGSKLPGIEVTPAEEVSRASVPGRRLSSISSDTTRLFHTDSDSDVPHAKQRLRETLLVHIPVRSGDGYFRLRITGADPRETLAKSPPFRVGSISWASAHPQGATPLGLVPELAVRSAFVAGKTAAYGAFYASFPFLKLAELTPGPWRQYAVRTLYAHALTEEQRASIGVNVSRGKEGLRRANENIYRTVPFGAVGVRTLADVEKDEAAGRGGYWFSW